MAASPPSTPQHTRTASTSSASASSPSAASSPQNSAFNPSGLPASAFAAPSATAYPGGPAQWGARMSGFSWALLHPHLPDGDVVDRWMEELGEQFIMKADMQIATGDGSAMGAFSRAGEHSVQTGRAQGVRSGGTSMHSAHSCCLCCLRVHACSLSSPTEVKNRTVVLTESNWIEMKMAEGVDPPTLPNPSSCALLSKDLGTKAQKQKKHKPLIEIHSVEIEPVVAGAPHPYAFRICFFSGSAASIAKAGFGKLKRVFSLSSDFDSFLKSKVVRCHSAEECSQWVTVFHCLLRNTWQSKIEKEILPEPEIYKRHAFVIKQHNDRLVLLSDFWSVREELLRTHAHCPAEIAQLGSSADLSACSAV